MVKALIYFVEDPLFEAQVELRFGFSSTVYLVAIRDLAATLAGKSDEKGIGSPG